MSMRYRKSRLMSTKLIWNCELCDYSIPSKRGIELHQKVSHGIDDKINNKTKSEIKQEIRKQKKERIGHCSECGKDMSLHSKKNGNCL